MTDDGLRSVLERSKALGLLGPGEIETHIAHAMNFSSLVASGDRVLDLGSGGGVPGLVLTVQRPDLRLTLLDAGERRVAFLRSAVRELDVVERVDVQLGRAEALARETSLREQFDVVVARSFATPAITAECAVGFLRTQGALLVSEPVGSGDADSDADPDRWPTAGLLSLGLLPGATHRFETATIRELRRSEADIAEHPRAVGIPARRPRF